MYWKVYNESSRERWKWELSLIILLKVWTSIDLSDLKKKKHCVMKPDKYYFVGYKS